MHMIMSLTESNVAVHISLFWLKSLNWKKQKTP